ncbi:MAG: DNA polymerase III subunit alpha [Acidobacteria bacterium]|nr:DNA polymerase III subunit alpha [Acidobacteriota bacterium]
MKNETQFVHLHLHSHYSLLDGANKIEAVVQRAVEYQMPALALTDHGNLFGAVQFHDIARSHGIKPIIGCEVYVAREGRKSRTGRSDQSNHLVLLAMDTTGYRNLVKLVSLAYLEGFYYRPRIDLELLQNHSAGLIALSACLKGTVAWHVAQDKYAEARREAGVLAEIFGRGNFYLELQDHGIREQQKVNTEILRLSSDLSLPLVATNDCHYLNQDDSFAHDVLLCIQTGKTINDADRLAYRTDQFFFKSAAEMAKLFGHLPHTLSNTLEIAEKCQFELGDTENVFPQFLVPAGFTLDSYFENIAREGLARRLPYLQKLESQGKLRRPLSEYQQRLETEIKMIQKMKFPSYFLIVWDFIRYAREQGIPVGPGRGSAAGSLVSYALQITDIDPLQYDLLFERFLNPDRITPPDIDIDFCMLRRNEVIDYVTQKYGRENVSQIITFGTMAARGAIRDVGRSLNIPYAEVDRLARLVPQTLDATLEKAVNNVTELQELAEGEPRYRQLLDTAQKLEGLARHASTHAAGVVISPQSLIERIPLYKSNKDEITTQYPMGDLERLGLLKMDFLALTTLTVIHQTLAQICKQLGHDLDLAQIDLGDEKTFSLFCEGKTSGVFQFESGGMRDILRRLRPNRFEDLIALNALYRPGPIQGGMIDDFIARRHGKIKIEYVLPQLEEILKETYGVIVYQEQVMQIASRLAGFSLGEADLLRRAMGKKKKEVMRAQKKKFLDGCKQRGLPADKAGRIFDLMEQFAGYGFNKSHSTAYALLAYQTAYLKAHYPVQFMAAMLTSEMSNTDKIVKYLGECKEMGIRVLPPDINDSELDFLACGTDIKFGLAAIRNVGEAAISSILACRRELDRFSGFLEFCEKVDLRAVNKRVLESLVKAGAFDSLGYHRKALLEYLDSAIEQAQKLQKDRHSGQRGLFAGQLLAATPSAGEDVPDSGEWTDSERWAHEKETLGYYVTGHPLRAFENEMKNFSQLSVSEISEELSGREVALAGIVTNLRSLRTRKGEAMAAFHLEDLTGTVEVLLWPNTFERCRPLLSTDVAVLVRGRCELDGQGQPRLLCSEMTPLADLWKKAVHGVRLRIPVEELNPEKVKQLRLLLDRYRGHCPLEFELLQAGQYRLRVIPNNPISINPLPAFLREVNELFGKNSVSLYT